MSQKKCPRRNTSTLDPLTPSLYGGTNEFAAYQQKQIAELCARLAGIERRYNGQQKRIGEQEHFITTLKTEGEDLRKRLRFLENATKLTPSPKEKKL